MTEAQAIAHLVARLSDAHELLEQLMVDTQGGTERYESLRQRVHDALRDALAALADSLR